MTGNTRQQVRAAFLAVVMVVSVFGMTVGLAGTAAAAASSLTVDDGAPAQPDGTIAVSTDVSAEGNDASFIVEDSNGNTYNPGTITDGGADDDDGEADGAVTVEIALADNYDGSDPAEGTATVYASEGGTVTTNDAEQTEEFTVDGTAPSSEFVSPASGERIDTTTLVYDLDISDELTSVNESTIEVSFSGPNGEIYTHNINTDGPEDGVDFDGDNLTVDFGADNIPELPEGQIDASVVVADEAGNENTLTSSFIVDTTPIAITLNAPTEGGTVADPTQNIEVALNLDEGESVEVAEITVEGDGYAVTNTTSDAVYDEGTSTFTLDPGTSAGVPELPDGPITVSVTAEDESGNQASETFGFEVDTNSPAVENIYVPAAVDGVINDSERRNGVDVIIEFNESVQADTVNAVIQYEGGPTDLDGSFVQLGNDDSVVVSEDNSVPSGLEDDGGSVNITAADDAVGNSFSGDENGTFAIDTLNPSVTYDAEFPSPVSGYVDLTDDVTVSDADGNERFYIVFPAQDTSKEPIVLENPSHVDTQQLPEGQHTFAAYAVDDAGNLPTWDEASVSPWTVDNEEPAISYVGPEVLSGDVVVTDLVDVENGGVEEVTIEWQAPGDDSFQSADSFNVNDQGEGQYDIRVTVDDPGYDGADNFKQQTFQVEGQSLDVVSSSVTPDHEKGTFTVNVTMDMPLDSLHVDYFTVDPHFDQKEDHFSLEKFEQVDSENGYKYTMTVDAPRDGAFEFVIKNASAGDQVLGGAESIETVGIDAEDPMLVDATIEGAGTDGRTQVALDFSEPVENINFGALQVDSGEQVTEVRDDDGQDGTIVVRLDDVLQTGNHAGVTYPAGTVEEAIGRDSNAETSSIVDTVDLQLSEGNNLVSVPAATGRLDVSELDTSNVNAIWAYDDGEWISHVPGADENDLTVLVGGQGYVFNMEADDEIPVRVYNEPGDTGSDAPSVPASEDVENGWNLIGHFQEADQPRDDALSTISDSYSPSMVLGEAGDGSYQAVSTLESGEAYWLFASDEDVYAEQPFTDAPAVFNLEAFDVEGDRTYTNLDAEDGEEVRVHASVNDPDGVDTVTFDSNVDDSVAEMSDDNGDGVYTADVTLDLTEKGGDVTIGDVTATDNAGESGTMGLDAFVNDQDASISGGQTNEPADGFATATTTETTEIEFYAQGVSADGDTDTLTLVVPQNIADQTDLANTVNFVETDNYAIEGGPTIVNVGGGTANGIQFDIAPDSGGDVDVTARVNVDLAYPAGDGTDHSFDAAVLDSDGSSETTTSGIAIVTGDERPALSSAVTSDTDDNGQIDQISVTFSEDVTDVEAADYDVDGYNVVGVNDAGDSDASTFGLVLEESGSGDTGATPTVTYQSDGVNDETVDAEQQGLEVPDGMSETPSDGADVQVMSLTGAGSQSLTLTLSENVGPNSDGSGTFDTSAYTYNDNTGDTESITGVTDDTGSDRTVTINLDDAAETDDSVTLDIAHNADDGSNISSPTTVGIES